MEKLQLTGKAKHSVDDSMKGLSAVLVDGDEIFIDNGAIHAKSRIEKGITFVRTPDDVPNGREVLGFWITLHRFDGKQGFYGAMPFTLLLDSEAQMGYKSLSNQVNGMDKAVKGQIDLKDVPDEIARKVGAFLRDKRPDLWENGSPEFREAFAH